MKKEVLITGGAGFIGSHLADALNAMGENIAILDDFNDFYDPELKRNNISGLARRPNASLYEGDICDSKILDTIFRSEKIETVVHLAARAGVRPSIKDPVLYEKVNIGGTQNLLEAARRYNVKKFIFASSSSVYGNDTEAPFSEDAPAMHPLSPYAATKRAGELLTYVYHRVWGIRSACLRFFTVYGERGRPDMAPYIFTRNLLKGEAIPVFGDGKSKRDYTYVGDIVRGIVSCLKKDISWEIINLGSGAPVAINDLILTLENITGVKARLKKEPPAPEDVNLTFADITKAKRILDWEPKTPLEDGLARFVRWQKDN